MDGFTLLDSDYSRVPDILLAEVQGFADSLEYERLNETERRLPGVVAASFTRFFVPYQDVELREGLTERDAKTLADAYRVIEQLAGSRDASVKTLVEDEIFENIRSSEATWRAIETRLGSQARSLLEQWRKKNLG